MLLLDPISIFFILTYIFRSVIYVLFSEAHTTCSLKAARYKKSVILQNLHLSIYKKIHKITISVKNISIY